LSLTTELKSHSIAAVRRERWMASKPSREKSRSDINIIKYQVDE